MGQVKQILYSLQNRFLGKSQSLPPCGARKNLRAARLLDFFDRCGCSASLHPPLAALGSAPPFPSPAAGEGDSIYNLYIKMRRRHLESVSAAPYGRCLGIVRIQPQLSGKRVLGRSPKRVLPTFARTKVGPRRAGVQAVTLR